MQPQENTPQEAPQTQPVPAAPVTPVAPPPAHKKSKLAAIMSVLLVLVLGGAVASYVLMSGKLSSRDKELATTKQSLTATQKELADAKAKIADLDNPQKKANDAKRKTDLVKFVSTLNEYAANNNGKFPTTEPTSFAKEFESKYITGKLTDFNDPQTKKAYAFTPVAKVQTPPGVTLGTIQYQWPGKCAGSEFDDNATDRQAAARLILESGDIYCIDA